MRLNTREGPILAGAMDLFTMHRMPCWRINSGALRDRNGRPVFFILGPDGKPFHGFSDLLSIVPGSGRMCVTETKAPGKQPTLLQRIFLETILGAGGVALAVDDLGIPARALDRLAVDPFVRLGLDGEPIR